MWNSVILKLSKDFKLGKRNVNESQDFWTKSLNPVLCEPAFVKSEATSTRSTTLMIILLISR